MAKKSEKMTKMQRRENCWGWFLISPMILKVLIFTVFPTVFCLIISFTDYNMLAARDKITKATLDNYIEVFTSRDFWRAMWNTVYLMLGIPIRLIIGFLLAYALNYKFLRGRTVFRVIYYLPAVSSAVAIALVWKWFFNTDGVFNALFGTDFAWLIDPDIVKNSLIIKGVWGGVGGTMLMYLAGMQNISEDIYEQAALDGASPLIKMFKITLPLLAPITMYLVLTGITGGLNAFADNYTMVSSSASNTAVFWIYNQFTGGNYPLVGAASFVLMMFVIVFSIPQYKKMIRDN